MSPPLETQANLGDTSFEKKNPPPPQFTQNIEMAITSSIINRFSNGLVRWNREGIFFPKFL